MPQLDHITFFSQIIWLVFTFVVLYLISCRLIIPSISRILLSRKIMSQQAKSVNLKSNEEGGIDTVSFEKSMYSSMRGMKDTLINIKESNNRYLHNELSILVNNCLKPITTVTTSEIAVRKILTNIVSRNIRQL